MELLVVVGFLIILVLGFYAGKLLFQLKSQNERQNKARQKRVDNITESIRTIALAMEQQQCNLSEGVIRLWNLLDAMPLTPQPNYQEKFPAIHSLFKQVEKFDTHDARNALPKLERRKQDKEREQLESEFESAILKEVSSLKKLEITL